MRVGALRLCVGVGEVFCTNPAGALCLCVGVGEVYCTNPAGALRLCVGVGEVCVRVCSCWCAAFVCGT